MWSEGRWGQVGSGGGRWGCNVQQKVPGRNKWCGFVVLTGWFIYQFIRICSTNQIICIPTRAQSRRGLNRKWVELFTPEVNRFNHKWLHLKNYLQSSITIELQINVFDQKCKRSIYGSSFFENVSVSKFVNVTPCYVFKKIWRSGHALNHAKIMSKVFWWNFSTFAKRGPKSVWVCKSTLGRLEQPLHLPIHSCSFSHSCILKVRLGRGEAYTLKRLLYLVKGLVLYTCWISGIFETSILKQGYPLCFCNKSIKDQPYWMSLVSSLTLYSSKELPRGQKSKKYFRMAF